MTNRFRVDLLLTNIEKWVEYTSRKGVSEEMAFSLATHLQRNSTGFRIVELLSKKEERVVKEWRPTQSTTKSISS